MPSDLPIVTCKTRKPNIILLVDNEDGNVWPTFASELKSRFPLKAIDFTNPLRPELHHIPQLEFDFKKYSSDMFPKFMPGAIQHNTFFLHLFIVSTDDVESYKNNSRKLIQEWLNVVGTKKNQDWMIIYCAEKTKGTRLFNMGQSASVYEKLKTDFNPKKDRFFHLSGALSAEPKNHEAWNELLIRIKDLVFSNISSQIIQYEEDARRLEQQRLIPGWNYCQYFILKEALSFTFEVLAMYEDVLVQYDELEATFFQTLYEQGAPWFKKFGGNEAGDDNPNIFDLSQKNYRDRIIQNSVSIYDFRMYLFSRQIRLLNILQRPIDIFIRSKLFISSFSRTIHDYRDSLPLYFREIWIFSMNLCIIRYCDELAAIRNYSSPFVMTYEGLKGELFLVARYQLDRLGIASKLIAHSLHYFSATITEQESDSSFDITTPELSRITSTNEQLTIALKSKHDFDDIYESISGKCLQSFEICKRDASVLYVKADLALLYFSRQNYQKAGRIFSEICFNYSKIGWNHIDTMLIERFAICQRQLKTNQDLIQCYLHLVRFPDFLELETYSFYLEQLKNCSMNASSVYESLNCSIFSIGSIVLIDDIGLDGFIFAEIQIFNSMAKEFEFDSISIQFKGGEGMEILFEVFDHILLPGSSHPRLRAERSKIAGDYFPLSVSLSRGKVKFLYDVPSIIQKSSKLKIEESLASVRFTAQPVFGEEQAIAFTILTNENSFSKALIEFETLSAVNIIFQKETLVTITDEKRHSSCLAVNCSEKKNSLELPCIGLNSIISFVLPVNILKATTIDHKIKIILSEISDDLQKSHAHTSIVDLFFFLPIHIEDFINQSAIKTLLIYKLYGKDKYPTRLVSFEILSEGDESLEVKELFPDNNQLLFHKNSINLSALLPSNISVPVKIVLTIKYRHIQQEIENYIFQKLRDSMDKFNVPQAVGKLKKLILRHFLAFINLADIFYYGKTALDPIDWSKIQPLLSNVPSGQKQNVQSAIEELNNELSVISEKQFNESSETLSTSKYSLTKVINPCVILIRAKWTLPSEDSNVKIHVGDLLDCVLVLETIIWKLDADELTIHSDMKIDKTNFAFSGKGRMIICVKKSIPVISFHYQLCPLNPGPLRLPLFHFKVANEESSGVYFEGPSEKINRAILPKEEICRRCFNEE